MSVPDELVQAAAEALCARRHPGLNGLLRACDRCKEYVGIVLQAAFGKLPECEAAVETLKQAHCLNRNHRIREALSTGGLSLVFGESPCGHTRCALTALAREFGGRK